MTEEQKEQRIKAGYYENCPLLEDGVQVGFSGKANAPEMTLAFRVPDLGGRTLSVILHFASEENARISMEQLRATGWSGEWLDDLTGIGTKPVTLEVFYESWEGKPQMKTRIVTGGGRIKVAKATDLKNFAAAVAMVTGRKPSAGGPPPPPFGD